VSHSLSHIKELPPTVYQIDLFELESDSIVFFLYLSGDRLYTAGDKNLRLYLMSDHTSPIATYKLGG
jgi:hypothetical protein